MSAWVARVTETPPAGPTACQSPGPLKDPALWTAAAVTSPGVALGSGAAPAARPWAPRERGGCSRCRQSEAPPHPWPRAPWGPTSLPSVRESASRLAGGEGGNLDPQPGSHPPRSHPERSSEREQAALHLHRAHLPGPHRYRDRPVEGTWDSLHSAPAGIPPGRKPPVKRVAASPGDTVSAPNCQPRAVVLGSHGVAGSGEGLEGLPQRGHRHWRDEGSSRKPPCSFR